jgi:LacI family transcriptional regulator
MKVSLKDLAQICGCSVTSVSRALKDSDTISKELREKVQSTARELGYIPNTLAGSMRTGYTDTIAVILPDLRNPYFSLLAKYMEEYASSRGYSVFFMTTNEITEHEHNAVIKAMQKNVDGILLLPNQQDTESIDILNKTNFPYVLFGRIFKNIKTDYVICNDKKGAYLATKHLIERGHKRILFLNSFMHIYSSVARLEGYTEALNEDGIEFNSKDIKTISTKIGDTEKIIRELFSVPNDYTAIFCYCDVIAFEAIYILNKMGFTVPKDIAVAGVDDIHSEIILPVQLTSASFNREEYAKCMIDTLIQKIKNPVHSPNRKDYKEIVLDVKLTIGQTT